MRKQYHFWPGERGLDAWDVDRLVELSAGLPVTEVELSSITEVDSPYWFEPSDPPPTVRQVVDHMRLVEAVDLSYPIILGPDRRVMDGMHRIARALLEGRDTIAAVVLEILPEPDFHSCKPAELPYD